jgi:hypothetical protein
MLAVGLDVAHVIDQVHRRGRQAEHDEGHPGLYQHVDVAVVDAATQRRQRCRQD